MSQVTLIPVFAIKPGRLEEFRAAAARLIERSNEEPGTLRYDQFLSDDGSRMVNIEVFADADAFVTHDRNVADLVPALVDAGPIVHMDVIGKVNDALRAQLANVDVAYLSPLGRIDR